MELRAKSGILRGREFIMKDLYSFHRDSPDLDNFYEQVKESYRKIFKAVGIDEETVLTLAAGGTFSVYSHEFQTLTPAGEDKIHVCAKCRLAINDEIIAEHQNCPACGHSERIAETGVEVGNTFKLGNKFSVPFELNYRDEAGKKQPVVMGCYGLGISRLMGAIVEVTADDRGLVWPLAVAPFRAHLISMENNQSSAIAASAKQIYDCLIEAGIETLWDDREATAGVKLADADLLGMPFRLVVSQRTVEKGLVEVKRRTGDRIDFIAPQKLCAWLG